MWTDGIFVYMYETHKIYYFFYVSFMFNVHIQNKRL